MPGVEGRGKGQERLNQEGLEHQLREWSSLSCEVSTTDSFKWKADTVTVGFWNMDWSGKCISS